MVRGSDPGRAEQERGWSRGTRWSLIIQTYHLREAVNKLNTGQDPAARILGPGEVSTCDKMKYVARPNSGPRRKLMNQTALARLLLLAAAPMSIVILVRAGDEIWGVPRWCWVVDQPCGGVADHRVKSNEIG